MATTKIAEAYLASGWCARCGYKRSTQGECPNCDHWYTHPLLTIGGSFTASLLVLFMVGIRAVRDADPNFDRFTKGLLAPAPMPAFVDPHPPVVRQTAPPVYFTATTAGTLPAITPVPAIEKQVGKIEDLRETVHVAERAYQSGVARSSGAAVSASIAPQSARAQVSTLSL